MILLLLPLALKYPALCPGFKNPQFIFLPSRLEIILRRRTTGELYYKGVSFEGNCLVHFLGTPGFGRDL